MGPGCACEEGKLHVAGRGSVSTGVALPTQGRPLPGRGAAHLPSGDCSLLVAELTVPPAGLEAPATA